MDGGVGGRRRGPGAGGPACGCRHWGGSSYNSSCVWRGKQAPAPSLAANTWSEKRSAGAVLHATPERSETTPAGRSSGLSPPASGRVAERSKAACARASRRGRARRRRGVAWSELKRTESAKLVRRAVTARLWRPRRGRRSIVAGTARAVSGRRGVGSCLRASLRAGWQAL